MDGGGFYWVGTCEAITDCLNKCEKMAEYFGGQPEKKTCRQVIKSLHCVIQVVYGLDGSVFTCESLVARRCQLLCWGSILGIGGNCRVVGVEVEDCQWHMWIVLQSFLYSAS